VQHDGGGWRSLVASRQAMILKAICQRICRRGFGAAPGQNVNFAASDDGNRSTLKCMGFMSRSQERADPPSHSTCALLAQISSFPTMTWFNSNCM
jgi:hypothetical protein